MALDRIITSRDSYGSVVTNYEPLAQVWAEKMPAKGAEKFIPGSGVTVATRAATWRIRYMPGVTELMRVVDDRTPETAWPWGLHGTQPGRWSQSCISMRFHIGAPGGHWQEMPAPARNLGTCTKGRSCCGCAVYLQ